MPDQPVHLVLWDIDHTLIQTRGVGREIYESIFPEVTGIPLRGLATVHGRTELDIIDETLRGHGITPTADIVTRMVTTLADAYRDRLDELRDRARVLPGVRAALSWLDSRGDVIQSVVTGNPRAVAILKLQATDLDGHIHWDSGAFGDDDRHRDRLIRLARERTTRHVPVAEVIVVGDTPNDVTAAKAVGARAIGAATGRFTTDDLIEAGADRTLADLSDLDEFQDAVAAVHP